MSFLIYSECDFGVLQSPRLMNNICIGKHREDNVGL
ncbi:hypothetical protein Zm00014a_040322 [Zea mays]|uniref:Uncharacterized protein n=1 Tax=Zea mays TaxID=4577 RepID=A0A3L6F8W1_MAIZE|nr:hypothetical protein Zm00014a_040322 [Zea mays]